MSQKRPVLFDTPKKMAELCRAAAMDLTRKQLTRELATWTVRLEGDAGRRGRVEAEIDGRRITRLRLGPP